MKHNRFISTLTVAAALLGAHPSYSQQEAVAVAAEEGKLGAARLVEAKAKVEAIDIAARKVTLRHEDGEVETILVGEQVKNLPQLKIGDVVTMQYYESLTVELNKIEGAAPALSEKSTEQRAELGQLPGGVDTQEVAVVAKVTAIDTAASSVTLTGPRGRSVELEVDPAVLAKIKVGDHVNAVYTQAVAVSVSRATE
jgi:Cu/Ag efflux protein CusF